MPDNLWVHYGWAHGKVESWDWGFDAENWVLDGRLRNIADKEGSSQKLYEEDSLDNPNTSYDQMGSQRFPDADLTEFFTPPKSVSPRY